MRPLGGWQDLEIGLEAAPFHTNPGFCSEVKRVGP